jgi:hypothetical protein
MQENTFIIEANFRSQPLAINHMWNFDVYCKVGVLNVYLGPWPDLPAVTTKSPRRLLPTG